MVSNLTCVGQRIHLSLTEPAEYTGSRVSISMDDHMNLIASTPRLF